MVRAFVQLNRVSVQFHSVTQSYLTLCDPMDCSTAGFPVHHQLPKLAQTHVNWVGDASQPHHLYRLLLLLPSIFPSIKLFSNESVPHIRWIKYWSFSFSISPSNEYSWLISFRIDWLDLLAVQGTQEYSPTPQFKRINSSVLSFLYSPTLIFIHVYWKVNQMLWQWDSGWKKKKQCSMVSHEFIQRTLQLFLWKRKLCVKNQQSLCLYYTPPTDESSMN